MFYKLPYLLMVSILVCLVGCGTDGGVNGTQTPTPGPDPTPEVTPPPTPEPTPTPVANIIYFEEKPKDRPDKSPGQPVNLCWEVERADSLQIQTGNGSPEPVTGECQTVSPDKSEKYTLIATGADNVAVKRPLEVKVVQLEPLITGFSADPETTDYGKKVTLHYRVVNAKHVYLSGEDLGSNNEGTHFSRPLFSNTEYILIAENSDRVRTPPRILKVRVNPPSHAQVSEFKSQRQEIPRGPGQICYQVSENSYVRIINTTANTEVFRTNTKTNGQRNCPQVAANIGRNVYALEVMGPDNERYTYERTESITVPPPPPGTAKLSLGRNSSNLEICYNGTNVTFARITAGPRRIGDVGAEPSKCFSIIPLPQETTTYLLDGTDKNNQPVRAHIDVSVPQPATVSISPHPNPNLFWFAYNWGEGALSGSIVCQGGYPYPLRPRQGRIVFPKSLWWGKNCALQGVGSHPKLIRNTPLYFR